MTVNEKEKAYIRKQQTLRLLRKLYPEVAKSVEAYVLSKEEVENLLIAATYELKQRIERSIKIFREMRATEKRLRESLELFPSDRKEYLSAEEYRAQWRKDYLQSLSSK